MKDNFWKDLFRNAKECAEELGISQDTMTRYKKRFQEDADWVIGLPDCRTAGLPDCCCLEPRLIL
jgi:hypothetical protein